jgi:PAS domain S-box-containing protein
MRGDVWLRAAWEAASDAMALSDPGGIVLAANPAYYTLYGYGPDEVLGRSFSIIFPEEERPGAEAQYREVFHSHVHPPAYEARVRRRDGTQRLVEARVSFVEEDGRRVAMLNVVTDITEHVAAREAAAQAEAEHRTFLSSVSHDIRNPLAVIRGQAQVLRRRTERAGAPPPPDVLTAGLTQIETSAAQLGTLLDELVAIASSRAGDLPPLTLTEMDLVALARKVLARYERLTERHRLMLTADVDSLVGQWDVARLERVLDNLLSNALKYSPDGGEVIVSIARSEGPAPGARLSVSDQGIGISKEDLPYVFDRYRRGGNVQAGIAGSGVGLTSVKLIVEQHGGAVDIQSHEGQGTTVTVRVPLAPQG